MGLLRATARSILSRPPARSLARLRDGLQTEWLNSLKWSYLEDSPPNSRRRRRPRSRPPARMNGAARAKRPLESWPGWGSARARPLCAPPSPPPTGRGSLQFASKRPRLKATLAPNPSKPHPLARPIRAPRCKPRAHLAPFATSASLATGAPVSSLCLAFGREAHAE